MSVDQSETRSIRYQTIPDMPAGRFSLDERIRVGEYMTIHPSRYIAFSPRKLDDGATIIYPGNKVGIIYLDEIPSLERGQDLTKFTRELITSTQNSLKDLARRCEANDPRFKKIKAFHGVSHLASRHIAQRLGFEVFDVNPLSKYLARLAGKSITRGIAGQNEQWKERYKRITTTPKDAYISRKKLIELYGSRAPSQTSPSRK